VKAATHSWEGAQSSPATLPALPGSTVTAEVPPDVDGYDEQFHLVSAEGEMLAHRPYRIVGDNGQVWEGVSDAEGLTQRIFTRTAVGLTVEVLPPTTTKVVE